MNRLEKIRISGGASMPGSISIISENFQSTATFKNKTKEIIVKTVELNQNTSKIIKNKKIPGFIRMFVFLASQLGWDIFIIFGIIILLDEFPWINPFNWILEPMKSYSHNLYNFTTYALLTILLGITIYFFINVRKFHAAEHMVIASFESNNSLRMEDIKQQDRISPRCGGRFLFPGMIGITFVSIFFEPIHNLLKTNIIISWIPDNILNLLLALIIIESVMQLDKIVGLWNIKIFRWASYNLQKFLTTSPPQDFHMKIARAAMAGIINKEIKKQIQNKNPD